MSTHLMTIGQLARKGQVTPRAIRYYELLGLLKAPLRNEANYRLFDIDSLNRIRFIAKCRSLGFPITEITKLLTITDDAKHTCSQVEEVTRRHLSTIDAKLQSLMEMRKPIAKCLSHCTAQDIPECAVLDYLKKTS